MIIDSNQIQKLNMEIRNESACEIIKYNVNQWWIGFWWLWKNTNQSIRVDLNEKKKKTQDPSHAVYSLCDHYKKNLHSSFWQHNRFGCVFGIVPAFAKFIPSFILFFRKYSKIHGNQFQFHRTVWCSRAKWLDL